MLKEKNPFILVLVIFVVLSFVEHGQAFLTKSDEELVLNGLQRLTMEGQLGENTQISFDRIACNPARCVLEMRAFNTQFEFGEIKKMKCVLEDLHSLFDVLDESEKNKTKAYYPFNPLFMQEVRTCLQSLSY